MTLAYADASALVKLILDEPDASSMRRWYIEAETVVTSHISAIETRRAIARKVTVPEHVDAVLRSVTIVMLGRAIGSVAIGLALSSLRTLDAIHLATALQIGDIEAFVTYDDRLAEAARALGLPVVRPA